jgi:hypothetical protein
MKKQRVELHPDVKIFRHKFTGVKAKSEDAEQMACAAWLNHKMPYLNWFHVPNEGSRTAHYADRMKRCGLKPGISDFVMLAPTRGYHGAVIELKREDGTLSQVSDEQREFLNKSLDDGYYAAVAFGFEEFKNAVCDYFGVVSID